MPALRKLTLVELKLFLRDPMAAFFALAFPPLLVVILGSVPAFREPSNDLGGLRVIDLYIPIVMALALAMPALNGLPTYLATYRERGILRRLATTPVGAGRMVVAQMALNVAVVVVIGAAVLAIGAAAYGTHMPRNPAGFAIAFVLAAAAMFGLGMLVAALASSGRMATAIGMILFYPLNFFAGLWLPREAMPALLRRIGDFTPLGAGVQSLQDSMRGAWPHPLHLAVMAAIAMIASLAAARWFRWE
jgi:ABC-2 type transport system permease protein